MLTVFLGLVILVFDIWAIMNILGSGVTVLEKLVWILLVLIFPVGGFIIWYFLGPKSARSAIA